MYKKKAEVKNALKPKNVRKKDSSANQKQSFLTKIIFYYICFLQKLFVLKLTAHKFLINKNNFIRISISSKKNNKSAQLIKICCLDIFSLGLRCDFLSFSKFFLKNIVFSSNWFSWYALFLLSFSHLSICIVILKTSFDNCYCFALSIFFQIRKSIYVSFCQRFLGYVFCLFIIGTGFFITYFLDLFLKMSSKKKISKNSLRRVKLIFKKYNELFFNHIYYFALNEHIVTKIL
ncbi:hypothetical protein RFI_03452 [Reticulomyxa filosa]|uniref:Transmembrane protein n=1 Tax=Reticulomyxa filosa TaxID=46433 RepID=X6P7P0_RETFI|nr:hypothetical protein RFI_03452 [Reticulomyxa filosa]|eukprot:ETO33652.1 hypothetical protein RFI_03452 [Reticulomyxa filosa]